MTDTLADQKTRLRAEAFARRDALDGAWRAEASRRIAEQALAIPDLVAASPVGAYWPMRSEVDPRPLLDALAERGRTLALSQTRHPHLSWREWRRGDVLVHGGFGVMEPGPDAPEVFPRALLVPLAAFDRAGGRVGYGKGHFDRSIAALAAAGPLLAVGVAFSAQEVEAVPMASHDRHLDYIVTEAGIVRPEPR